MGLRRLPTPAASLRAACLGRYRRSLGPSHRRSERRPRSSSLSTLLASHASECEMAIRPERLRPRRVSQWGLAFTFLVSLAAGASPAARDALPARAAASAGHEPELTQYRAYRRMHAQSERFGQEGWLEAWTELDAQGFR